jgi:hypothetical protein
MVSPVKDPWGQIGELSAFESPIWQFGSRLWPFKSTALFPRSPLREPGGGMLTWHKKIPTTFLK